METCDSCSYCIWLYDTGLFKKGTDRVSATIIYFLFIKLIQNTLYNKTIQSVLSGECMYTCLYACTYRYIYMYAYIYKDQRLASTIFFNFALLYFLRQDLSVNPELTNWLGWLTSKFQSSLICLWFLSTRLTEVHTTPGFYLVSGIST